VSLGVNRALRRALTVRDGIVIAVVFLVTYSPQIMNSLKLIDLAAANFVAMRPWLEVAVTSLFSPYFPIVAVSLVVVLLLWRHWPIAHGARAEFFIEMLEQRITVAKRVLKHHPDVSMNEWKQWEGETIIDLNHYLDDESGYFAIFQHAGNLTTFEYTAGHAGIRAAFNRQVRALRAIIDATDEGKIQKEAALLRAARLRARGDA
jgi:hypothetical protein